MLPTENSDTLSRQDCHLPQPHVSVLTGGEDYTSISNVTVNFSGDQNTVCIDIDIIDDEICELNERFTVNFTTSIEVNIDVSTSTVTIIDNDCKSCPLRTCVCLLYCSFVSSQN